MLKVFGIRNAKADCFENRPFFARSHGEAERVFQNEVTRQSPDNFVWKYPEDYDLYFLGEYDEQTGVIRGLDTPQHLAKAISYNTPEKSIHAV